MSWFKGYGRLAASNGLDQTMSNGMTKPCLGPKNMEDKLTWQTVNGRQKKENYIFFKKKLRTLATKSKYSHAFNSFPARF